MTVWINTDVTGKIKLIMNSKYEQKMMKFQKILIQYSVLAHKIKVVIKNILLYNFNKYKYKVN